MTLPYSSRTLLSPGKARETATLCERTNADAAIFLTPLTKHQQQTLTDLLGRPAISLVDLRTTA